MLDKSFKVSAFLLFVVVCCSSLMAQERSGSGIGPGKLPEGTSRVFISSKPDPEAPKEIAVGSGITIVLRAVFTADGVVTSVRFWKAEPKDTPKERLKDLTKLAIQAAKEIKFTPATRDGRPVSMRMQLEYNFSPEKQDQPVAEPAATDPPKSKDKKPGV